MNNAILRDTGLKQWKNSNSVIEWFNAENSASHKYVVQNGRSMFRAISESVGNLS